MINHLLRGLLPILFFVFCIAYIIAVIGMTWDIHPPFAMAWAASLLLFLEGTLLIMAACITYTWQVALSISALIIVCSYLIEALGVSTGIPFGLYDYTNQLQPLLPAHVPLPILFAWIQVLLGVYGWMGLTKTRITIIHVLPGAILTTLFDLTLEPVAAHIVHYWNWQATREPTYYGIPLENFIAWFAIAFVFLVIINRLCQDMHLKHRSNQSGRSLVSVLPLLTPRILFVSGLVMFGLIDLSHGYYAAAIIALSTLVCLGVWYKLATT